jgi:hypothetical protein
MKRVGRVESALGKTKHHHHIFRNSFLRNIPAYEVIRAPGLLLAQE